jgi:hypothetical protein
LVFEIWELAFISDLPHRTKSGGVSIPHPRHSGLTNRSSDS